MTQAVTAGDVDAVNAALAAGADVNERNNGGQTALILAVIFNHIDLVHLLVKAGVIRVYVTISDLMRWSGHSGVV